MKNGDEGWLAGFRFERSALPDADMFFGVDTNYMEVGKYNSLELRVTHTRELSLGILATLGLKPKTDDTK